MYWYESQIVRTLNRPFPGIVPKSTKKFKAVNQPRNSIQEPEELGSATLSSRNRRSTEYRVQSSIPVKEIVNIRVVESPESLTSLVLTRSSRKFVLLGVTRSD
jgi:hypothetical protein